MVDKQFWSGKRVFITGHTGFKGAWLSLYLSLLGAKVFGYALKPPTRPSLFQLCRIDQLIHSITGDIRNYGLMKRVLCASKPDVVIHMAAQPLVRESYKQPIMTYATNVMGTANLLEACRNCPSIKAIINVTTDKVYENRFKDFGEPFDKTSTSHSTRLRRAQSSRSGHRATSRCSVESLRAPSNVEVLSRAGQGSRGIAFIEDDPLGGYDPYSSSKACSEMVTAAYRSSFLSPVVAVATARAGNVIGGGDWAKDRLIPDFVRAILKNEKIYIRNPQAVRPWQHVLEPLTGYLLLAEKLCKQGGKFAGAWNFGPDENDTRTVAWIVKKLCRLWGEGCSYIIDKGKHPHEAPYLRLDSAKARQQLKWGPKWNLTAALDKIIVWMRAYQAKENLREICFRQIEEHLA